MSALRRVGAVLIGLPAAVLLIALAIANRHPVQLVLDPLQPNTPLLSLVLPFYVYLFAMLLAGVVLGGAAAWLGQSRWRRTARARSHDAARWQAEADRLTRERDQATSGQRQLAALRGLAIVAFALLAYQII